MMSAKFALNWTIIKEIGKGVLMAFPNLTYFTWKKPTLAARLRIHIAHCKLQSIVIDRNICYLYSLWIN